jgi:flagellar biosynthesis component FlhA
VFEALAYVNATPRVEAVEEASLLDKLGGTEVALPERLGELLALVCRSAISAQPGVLLPDSRLRAALDLGVSIAGQDAGPQSAPPGDGQVERLIAELAARTVDLVVDPAYLRALTTEDPDLDSGRITAVRDELFMDLGLLLPDCHVRFDPSLRPGGFAFRFHGVRTIPRIGLSPETVLVNDTPERLRLMNVEAEPTVDPATGRPAAIVARDRGELLEAAGLTTWDALGYLLLTFKAALQQNAHVLMTADLASRMVKNLGSAFPALTSHDYVAPEVLAPILRELLLDGVSIRNLRLIMELLLRYETALEDVHKGDRVTFVRAGLSAQIAFKAARNTATIVAYLIDPALEDALIEQHRKATDDASDDAPAERLCAALQAELAYLPSTAQVPVVLTRDEVRRPLRAALRYQFPQITVLGYGDLPSQYNVQPVARISWAEPDPSQG